MDSKILVNRLNNHSTVLVLLVIFILLSLLGTILPLLQTPQGRIYNGMHGYSDDYVGYVSYVKEGMYGNNTFTIRSLPPPQTPTSANLTYIGLGKIASLFSIDAPTAYHLGRVVFGFIYAYLVFLLMHTLFNGHVLALIATIFSFIGTTIGWYEVNGGRWDYHALSMFGFVDNVNGRLTPRPHYLVGNIMFLITLLVLLKDSVQKRIFSFILGAFSAFVASITHPTSGVLFVIIIFCMTPFQLVRENARRFMHIAFFAGIGALGGLALSYWSVHQYPYTAILAFERYVLSEKLAISTIIGDIISFGPIAWIGVPTLFIAFLRGRNDKKIQVMFFWIGIQLLLFFFLYPLFRAERFRFLQTSYFIPMAYGTTLALLYVSKHVWKGALAFGSTVLILISVPTYIHATFENIYAMTNYKNFSPFVFPTTGQIEAFQYLDKNTPKESTVLASWEASNLMLLYSHNYVVGNTQGWSGEAKENMVANKDTFFRGFYSEEEAKNYLKNNSIRYIYDGYQEKSMGNITKYTFLKQIFHNTETTIYEVK